MQNNVRGESCAFTEVTTLKKPKANMVEKIVVNALFFKNMVSISCSKFSRRIALAFGWLTN